MATGVGRLKIWLTSFDSVTPKTPCCTNRYPDIQDKCYTSRITDDFVLNFVAIATGVGRGRICLTSFNSLSPKTPCWTQRSPRYLLYKPSYSRFCLKFRCHGNRGHQGINLNDAVKLAVPENHAIEPKITTLSCVQPEFWQFKEFLNFPHRRHCNFSIFSNKSVKYKNWIFHAKNALPCAEPRHTTY